MDSNNVTLVPAEQQAQISRVMLQWLSGYSDKPLARLDYENLGETSGLALSVIQGAIKTRQYIDGTYQAQYQFKIIYRAIAENAADRLDMDEALNEFGSWAENNTTPPFFGDNIIVRKIKRDTAAAQFARYENGAEDHQILMTLIYEVI